MNAFTPMPSAITTITVSAKPGVRRSERSAYLRSWSRESTETLLFVAQRDDGVDAHGARDGQPGREHGARSEQDGDDGERGRIVGTDTEQDAGHEPRAGVRDGETQEEPDQREPRRLPQD